MRLADSQQLFSQALSDYGATPQALSMFKGVAHLNAERFALYRGNLAAAWEKSLANAYPVLLQLVGEEFFNALAREYGRAFPSQEGDLNRFGDHFAEFLAGFPHVADYPYFPDMARLEWMLHRAHYATLSEPLNLDVIARLTPQELEGACLVLQESCSLFASPWSVVEMWHGHQEGAANGFPQEMMTPNHALVLRSGWKAVPLSLDSAAHAVLQALHAGGSIGAALDAAAGIDPHFDFGRHLQTWLQHGVFTGLRLIEHKE